VPGPPPGKKRRGRRSPVSPPSISHHRRPTSMRHACRHGRGRGAQRRGGDSADHHAPDPASHVPSVREEPAGRQLEFKFQLYYDYKLNEVALNTPKLSSEIFQLLTPSMTTCSKHSI
jgi:hypothetical protein